MNRLLYIKGSPRGGSSRTLSLAAIFLEKFLEKYPTALVDELDLFTEKLPELYADIISGKYLLVSGRPVPPELKERWREIEAQINRFAAADGYLLATPMWNFGMPYKLKHYIDVIMQPRYLYRYRASGPEGLLKGRTMYVITTRGGDYSKSSPHRSMDCLEPHIRTIFSLAGITDFVFLSAQPMDAGEEKLKPAFDKCVEEIRKLQL
jgi:FMN-dependent NADH-azoreductase